MSGTGRGGARHKAKPYVDPGLLFQVLDKHEDLVTDLKGYEVLSRNSAVDPKALHSLLPLLNALLDLVPSAECHPGSLRQALCQMLQKKPCLNTSKFTGSVWINMRAERLGTFLSHVRKVSKGTGDQSLCVNLTGLEYSMVQDTLKKVQHHDPHLSDKSNTLKKDQGAALKKVKHDDPQPSDKESKVSLKKDPGAATLKKVTTKTLTKDAATLKKVTTKTLKKDAATLKKGLPERKKLKKTLSDVSVDSWGIPKELASPSKTSETSPPRIWKRKKVGGNRSTVPEDEGHPKLQEAMGFKKPAAFLKKEKGTRKPATSSSLKKDHTLKKDERKPWKKISKTVAKNPARSYLVGAHEKLDKAKLIVEVSQKKSKHYSWIIDKIWEALLKDHLTKAEAVQMRETMCLQYP